MKKSKNFSYLTCLQLYDYTQCFDDGISISIGDSYLSAAEYVLTKEELAFLIALSDPNNVTRSPIPFSTKDGVCIIKHQLTVNCRRDGSVDIYRVGSEEGKYKDHQAMSRLASILIPWLEENSVFLSLWDLNLLSLKMINGRYLFDDDQVNQTEFFYFDGESYVLPSNPYISYKKIIITRENFTSYLEKLSQVLTPQYYQRELNQFVLWYFREGVIVDCYRY